jgi:hypothetical protein
MAPGGSAVPGRSAVPDRTADWCRTGVTLAPAGSPVPVVCGPTAEGDANGCHDGAAVSEGAPPAGDGGGVVRDRVAGGGASVVGAARGCAAEDPKPGGTSCSDGGGSSPSSIFRPCRMRARTARSLRHDRARHHVNVPPSPSGWRSWLPCVRGKADISWRSTIKPSSPKAGDVAQCDYLTTINNDNLGHDHCSGVQSKSSTLSLFSQFNRHNTCALFPHPLRNSIQCGDNLHKGHTSRLAASGHPVDAEWRAFPSAIDGPSLALWRYRWAIDGVVRGSPLVDECGISRIQGHTRSGAAD